MPSREHVSTRPSHFSTKASRRLNTRHPYIHPSTTCPVPWSLRYQGRGGGLGILQLCLWSVDGKGNKCGEISSVSLVRQRELCEM